ncbi:P63C domain-containing protein [Bergeyella sp. RCAD1439]|uniref:P63C domain-containing protein n=1 Tax=Bergeyella anatis TaxID=3113737 RepID=UPI002E16BDE0|nr:P63C domain-containing protein [Bergeyella sp. RCAD1439]
MSKKLLKATHQGELDLNGFKISSAVLEDGTRVLVNRSLALAFGIKGSGNYWAKKKEQKGALLPEYLSAKYLESYISSELMSKLSEPIPYVNKQGVETEGVPAELLSDICDVYVKAGEKGAFKNNSEIAENAYKILLAFSKVGIIALVDEVTGYQHERENDELQKILHKYIAPELLPWQKRFPDVYYKELFRLNGWDYTVKGIQKRPGVIGKWTNTLIYSQLPQGVLVELKKITPKSADGNYTARFHQNLTLDIGEPNLTQQINQIVTLFQLSDNMKHMWQQFEKLKIRQSGQLELPFTFDEEGHTIEPLDETKLSCFDKKLKKGLDFNPKDTGEESEK